MERKVGGGERDLKERDLRERCSGWPALNQTGSESTQQGPLENASWVVGAGVLCLCQGYHILGIREAPGTRFILLKGNARGQRLVPNVCSKSACQRCCLGPKA